MQLKMFNKKENNTIEFLCPKDNLIFPTPKPANKFIPDWYKKLKKNFHPENIEGKSKFIKDNKVIEDGTVKKCMPFLDSFSMGYIVPTIVDIIIHKTEDSVNMRYNYKHPFDEPLFSKHNIKQFKGSHFKPNTHEDNMWKYNIPWRVKTPPGYSCIFTTPFNRPELPFQPLTGVVDTDSMFQINTPFILNLEEGEHLIEAGTPVVQIIPFKREPWNHNIKEFTKNDLDLEVNLITSFFNNFYKRNHHKKKTFL